MKAQGAVFKTVDYSNHSALVAALQGIDVVVSAISGRALTAQIPPADAAKEAGVKHMVLSEYGNPSDGKEYGYFVLKHQARQHALDIGLPFSQFYTAPFSDWFFVGHPEFGFDLPNNKAIVRGSGNVPISWTSRADSARYIVYVLTQLSPAQLKNAPLAIEGKRGTINEVLEQYQARTGKKLTITNESTEFLEKQVKAHADDFENGLVRLLFLELERGNGTTAIESGGG